MGKGAEELRSALGRLGGSNLEAMSEYMADRLEGMRLSPNCSEPEFMLSGNGGGYELRMCSDNGAGDYVFFRRFSFRRHGSEWIGNERHVPIRTRVAQPGPMADVLDDDSYWI